jgi:hypothetical protein
VLDYIFLILKKGNVKSKIMKIYNYVSAERRHSGKTVENNYNIR